MLPPPARRLLPGWAAPNGRDALSAASDRGGVARGPCLLSSPPPCRGAATSPSTGGRPKFRPPRHLGGRRWSLPLHVFRRHCRLAAARVPQLLPLPPAAAAPASLPPAPPAGHRRTAAAPATAVWPPRPDGRPARRPCRRHGLAAASHLPRSLASAARRPRATTAVVRSWQSLAGHHSSAAAATAAATGSWLPSAGRRPSRCGLAPASPLPPPPVSPVEQPSVAPLLTSQGRRSDVLPASNQR